MLPESVGNPFIGREIKGNRYKNEMENRAETFTLLSNLHRYGRRGVAFPVGFA
jgi:hypothetical protein